MSSITTWVKELFSFPHSGNKIWLVAEFFPLSRKFGRKSERRFLAKVVNARFPLPWYSTSAIWKYKLSGRIQRRALPRFQSEEIKILIKHFTSSSRNRTHNLSHLQPRLASTEFEWKKCVLVYFHIKYQTYVKHW